MKYYIFRLSFPNGAHFGDGNLDSYNMTFHADTLFSALFIGRENLFYRMVSLI